MVVPEALPELSTCNQDIELDITLDEVAPQLSENTQPDTEEGTEQELLTEGERHLISKIFEM